MLIDIKEASKRFEELVDRAIRGEEVIISDGGRLAKLVAVNEGRFKHGILKDQLSSEGMPDFLEPMSEEDLALWEGGDEHNR